MPLILKAVIALGLLWGMVFGIMSAAGYYKVTPEKIDAYVRAHPLDDSMDEAARKRRIESVAAKINQLDFEQRQQARDRGEKSAMRGFYGSLKREEWAHFVELTAGPHFDAVMKSFNDMEPAQRKETVAQILKEMKAGERLSPQESQQLEEGGVELFEKVASEGLRSYYSEASAETKLDLAPVLEQMQKTMQERRPRIRRPANP